MNNEEIIKKLCVNCGVKKELSEYYTQIQRGKLTYKSYCKECCKQKIVDKRLELIEEEGFYYYSQPHIYWNEQQERDVKEFLTVLGWYWNNDFNEWNKENVKIGKTWLKIIK